MDNQDDSKIFREEARRRWARNKPKIRSPYEDGYKQDSDLDAYEDDALRRWANEMPDEPTGYENERR